MKRVSRFFLCAAAFVLFQVATAPRAFADPILGPNLSTFAILGGGGVTIGGTGSVINGNIGGYPTTSVTGVIPTNYTQPSGTTYTSPTAPPTTDPRALAQGELAASILALSGMTVTSNAVVVGGGQTLAPGVYSSSSAMNISGALTLNGATNPNGLWVFQVGSALNFASSSVVNLINAGPNAGVYWVMPTTSGSAVLTSTLVNPTTVVGNFLANISITLAPGVTNSCGGFYTQTASVTLAGSNTIGIGCAGGGTITGGVVTPTPPTTTVPEPSTLLLLGTGIAGLVARGRRSGWGRQRNLAPKAA